VGSRKKRLNVQMDEDEYEKLQEKAAQFGPVSSVIRAMIRAFLGGETNFDPNEVIRDQRDKDKPGPKPKK
jgi:hypothetical protein